jgi:transmembrane sensor
MNIHNIDDLITKFLSGEANPDEAIQLEVWIKSSKENADYFSNMEQAHHLIYNTERSTPNKELAWQKLNHKKEKKSINLRWIYGIVAASFVLISGVIFLMNQSDNNQIIASDVAIHKVLNDKSEIDLQPNSQITFNKAFGITHRKMQFTGKANFKVKHNDTMPFVIESQGVFIEDLGTEFSVVSEPTKDTIYVVVNEGIVRLYDEDGHEIIIKAGEKAWYIKSKKQIISDKDTKVVKFDFKDTKLSEAIQLIGKTYDVAIELSPSSIGDCTITTQFFDEELATIITIITETLGFRYEYNDNTYKIIGKPCQ